MIKISISPDGSVSCNSFPIQTIRPISTRTPFTQTSLFTESGDSEDLTQLLASQLLKQGISHNKIKSFIPFTKKPKQPQNDSHFSQKTILSYKVTPPITLIEPFELWMKPQKYGNVKIYSWKNALAIHTTDNKDEILFIKEPDAHIYKTLTDAELDQYLLPCTDSQRALYMELREVLEDIRIGAYSFGIATTSIDNNSESIGDVSEGVGTRIEYEPQEF